MARWPANGEERVFLGAAGPGPSPDGQQQQRPDQDVDAIGHVRSSENTGGRSRTLVSAPHLSTSPFTPAAGPITHKLYPSTSSNSFVPGGPSCNQQSQASPTSAKPAAGWKSTTLSSLFGASLTPDPTPAGQDTPGGYPNDAEPDAFLLRRDRLASFASEKSVQSQRSVKSFQSGWTFDDSGELSPKSTVGQTQQHDSLPDYPPLDDIIQSFCDPALSSSSNRSSTFSLNSPDPGTMYPGAKIPQHGPGSNGRRPTGTFQLDDGHEGRPRLASGASFPRKQSTFSGFGGGVGAGGSSFSTGHSIYEDASPLDKSGRVPAYQAISAMRKPSYAFAPPGYSSASDYAPTTMSSPGGGSGRAGGAGAGSYFPAVPPPAARAPTGMRTLTRPAAGSQSSVGASVSAASAATTPVRPGWDRADTTGSSIDFSRPIETDESGGGSASGGISFASPFGSWTTPAAGGARPPLPSPVSPTDPLKPFKTGSPFAGTNWSSLIDPHQEYSAVSTPTSPSTPSNGGMFRDVALDGVGMAVSGSQSPVDRSVSRSPVRNKFAFASAARGTNDSRKAVPRALAAEDDEFATLPRLRRLPTEGQPTNTREEADIDEKDDKGIESDDDDGDSLPPLMPRIQVNLPPGPAQQGVFPLSGTGTASIAQPGRDDSVTSVYFDVGQYAQPELTAGVDSRSAATGRGVSGASSSSLSVSSASVARGTAASRRSARLQQEKQRQQEKEKQRGKAGGRAIGLGGGGGGGGGDSRSQASMRRPFQSTRLKEEIYKPWLEKTDPAQRWARWITLMSIFIGFAVSGVICYTGYTAVPRLGNTCMVLDDDFSSGLNTNTWTREVRLDGYNHGEFEWTTASDDNSFVSDGTLYLVPTLTSDVIGAGAVTNGYTLNLTADGSCTSANVSQCVAVSNSSRLTVINPVRSARLSTRNSVNIRYGKVEIVAKLPTGDWLWPQITLLPVNETYGAWPRSGQIDILTARGNNASYPTRGVDYVQSDLHWGPTVDLDRMYQTWGYREERRTYYNQEYHTYGFEWNDEYLWTYIDTRVAQVMSLRFNSQSMWNSGRFPSTVTNSTTGDVVKLQNPWINSPNNNAPFDQPFYLAIGLGVGGTNGWFPDGEGGKPWLDNSGTAMSDFWIAKDKWWDNWSSDPKTRGFAIKSVKMWKTC